MRLQTILNAIKLKEKEFIQGIRNVWHLNSDPIITNIETIYSLTDSFEKTEFERDCLCIVNSEIGKTLPWIFSMEPINDAYGVISMITEPPTDLTQEGHECLPISPDLLAMHMSPAHTSNLSNMSHMSHTAYQTDSSRHGAIPIEAELTEFILSGQRSRRGTDLDTLAPPFSVNNSNYSFHAAASASNVSNAQNIQNIQNAPNAKQVNALSHNIIVSDASAPAPKAEAPEPAESAVLQLGQRLSESMILVDEDGKIQNLDAILSTRHASSSHETTEHIRVESDLTTATAHASKPQSNHLQNTPNISNLQHIQTSTLVLGSNNNRLFPTPSHSGTHSPAAGHSGDETEHSHASRASRASVVSVDHRVRTTQPVSPLVVTTHAQQINLTGFPSPKGSVLSHHVFSQVSHASHASHASHPWHGYASREPSRSGVSGTQQTQVTQLTQMTQTSGTSYGWGRGEKSVSKSRQLHIAVVESTQQHLEEYRKDVGYSVGIGVNRVKKFWRGSARNARTARTARTAGAVGAAVGVAGRRRKGAKHGKQGKQTKQQKQGKTENKNENKHEKQVHFDINVTGYGTDKEEETREKSVTMSNTQTATFTNHLQHLTTLLGIGSNNTWNGRNSRKRRDRDAVNAMRMNAINIETKASRAPKIQKQRRRSVNDTAIAAMSLDLVRTRSKSITKAQNGIKTSRNHLAPHKLNYKSAVREADITWGRHEMGSRDDDYLHRQKTLEKKHEILVTQAACVARIEAKNAVAPAVTHAVAETRKMKKNMVWEGRMRTKSTGTSSRGRSISKGRNNKVVRSQRGSLNIRFKNSGKTGKNMKKMSRDNSCTLAAMDGILERPQSIEKKEDEVETDFECDGRGDGKLSLHIDTNLSSAANIKSLGRREDDKMYKVGQDGLVHARLETCSRDEDESKMDELIDAMNEIDNREVFDLVLQEMARTDAQNGVDGVDGDGNEWQGNEVSLRDIELELESGVKNVSEDCVE